MQSQQILYRFRIIIALFFYAGLYFRYAEYKINDYHLETLIEENLYFIVSPKDIVVASLYEYDDRVKWLIDHG